MNASLTSIRTIVAMADMPFIVSTGTKKVDPRTRKLIRSHVMIGKNRGKSRYRQAEADPSTPADTSTDDTSAPPADGAGSSSTSPAAQVPATRLPLDLPRRVGNDMSLIRLADDTTSPAALATILRCRCRVPDSHLPVIRWGPLKE